MQLSIANVSDDDKIRMTAERATTKKVHQTAEEGERVRCLCSLLTGHTLKTLYGYRLQNEVIEKLAKDFPSLIVEK